MFLQFHPQPVVPVDCRDGAVGNSSVSLNVVPGFTYRIAVDTNTYIKLTKGAGTATTSDILLLAGNVVYWIANGWDTVSFIKDSAVGNISIVRVQNI